MESYHHFIVGIKYVQELKAKKPHMFKYCVRRAGDIT